MSITPKEQGINATCWRKLSKTSVKCGKCIFGLVILFRRKCKWVVQLNKQQNCNAVKTFNWKSISSQSNMAACWKHLIANKRLLRNSVIFTENRRQKCWMNENGSRDVRCHRRSTHARNTENNNKIWLSAFEIWSVHSITSIPIV